MNNIPKTILQICFLAILAMFTLYSAAFASTQISGTVTAKRAGSVKVEFIPHKTAGPQSGDLVDFKTMMQGMEVNAGQGEVTESETNFAWVKIKKGRPNLKMTAFIHATGKPGPVEYFFDIDAMREKEKVLLHGAKLKMKLQSGLKFKNFRNINYKTKLSDGTSLSVSTEVQGWQAMPLNKHHRSHIKVQFSNDENNTCSVVWRERGVEGTSAFCIASRAQCKKYYGSLEKKYFRLYASCKAKSFAGQSPGTEPYFSFSLTDRYGWNDGNDPDHAEIVFLNMLRSLAIEGQQ